MNPTPGVQEADPQLWRLPCYVLVDGWDGEDPGCHGVALKVKGGDVEVAFPGARVHWVARERVERRKALPGNTPLEDREELDRLMVPRGPCVPPAQGGGEAVVAVRGPDVKARSEYTRSHPELDDLPDRVREYLERPKATRSGLARASGLTVCTIVRMSRAPVPLRRVARIKEADRLKEALDRIGQGVYPRPRRGKVQDVPAEVVVPQAQPAQEVPPGGLLDDRKDKSILAWRKYLVDSAEFHEVKAKEYRDQLKMTDAFLRKHPVEVEVAGG